MSPKAIQHERLKRPYTSWPNNPLHVPNLSGGNRVRSREARELICSLFSRPSVQPGHAACLLHIPPEELKSSRCVASREQKRFHSLTWCGFFFVFFFWFDSPPLGSSSLTAIFFFSSVRLKRESERSQPSQSRRRVLVQGPAEAIVTVKATVFVSIVLLVYSEDKAFKIQCLGTSRKSLGKGLEWSCSPTIPGISRAFQGYEAQTLGFGFGESTVCGEKAFPLADSATYRRKIRTRNKTRTVKSHTLCLFKH